MKKVFVVTGATAGIGLAAAEQLAKMGVLMIGVGRSAERCETESRRLQSAYPKAEVVYLLADLSLQHQVRELAKKVGEELGKRNLLSLDGLINDAGTFTWQRRVTAEGFEQQWAVNHLAPFLLTHELLPLLEAAGQGRVVTVSSGSHYNTRLCWNDLQLEHGYNGLRMYKQTKLCNVYFIAELRRRLAQTSRVRAFAADPGLVRTKMGQKGTPALIGWFWRWWSRRGKTSAESARGVVFLATEASINDRPEVYWKHRRPQPPNPLSLEAETGKRLWEISANMCGVD
jgi:retinol dehydrogenase 12